MSGIDRDSFSTITQLAETLGKVTSSSAIRRHIRRYPEYFNTTFDRGVQYVETEPGLKVLGVIIGAIRAGRNRGGHDVIDALKKADIEPIPVEPEPSPLPPNGVNGLNGTKRIIFELGEDSKAWIAGKIEELKGGVK